MTIADIIYEFLKYKLGVENSVIIGSHTIQLAVREFAKSSYEHTVNPETFSREWRRIRKNEKLVKWRGFIIREEKFVKQNYYKIERI